MYKYDWWGHVKGMIRRYPGRQGRELHGVALAEQEAVQSAIDDTECMTDGGKRLELINMVFWENQYKLPGAALQIPCSERTALRWHSDFVKLVAKKRGLMD